MYILQVYLNNIFLLCFGIQHNGWNYVQLPTAGGFPVKPHRRCCGLHGLLSTRKRQLTYSFCYAVGYHFSPLLLFYRFFKKSSSDKISSVEPFSISLTAFPCLLLIPSSPTTR